MAINENWGWVQDYLESGGVIGPNNVADNVVGFVDHIITNSSQAPRYIVRADAQSKNNRILGGITRGHYWQSAVTDSGQSNTFNLGDSTSNLLQNGGMDVAYYGKTVVTSQGNGAGSGDPSTTPDTAGIGWKSWLNSPTPSYTQTEIVTPSRLVVLSGNPSTNTHSGTGALYVETQGNKGQGISARSASSTWWSGATNPHPGMHALWTDEKAGQKLKLRGWLMPITDHPFSIWLGNNAQGFNIVKVNEGGGQNGQWIPFEVVGHNSPSHLDTVINIYTLGDATAATDRVVKFVVDNLTLEVMP
ncbi:MAG TPA: hypothetical protein EYN66_11420 [Myxococcales bacterium]|nr:hypothetical protein [Myxococcales bacterium]